MGVPVVALAGTGMVTISSRCSSMEIKPIGLQETQKAT